MTTNDHLAAYRAQFERELADQLGVTVDALPVAVPKDQAAAFLGLTNARTLNSWAHLGRNGITMLKVGRATLPTTRWLVDFKTSSIRIAAAAA